MFRALSLKRDPFMSYDLFAESAALYSLPAVREWIQANNWVKVHTYFLYRVMLSIFNYITSGLFFLCVYHKLCCQIVNLGRAPQWRFRCIRKPG